MSEASVGSGASRERGSALREFQLAGRLVQPALNRIRNGVATVQVEPKVMHVLLRLAERPGEVVTKEQLIDEVWAGVYVTEDVLVRAVRELRKLFDDDSETPRIIETIRKRGYRLVAPVVYDGARESGWIGADPTPLLPRGGGRLKKVLWAGTAVLAIAAIAMLFRLPRRLQPRFAPLSSLPGNEYDPALSPDGTRVAFAWDGGGPGPTDLYVKLVDAEPPLALTHEHADDRAPVWSPDGSRIAFLRVSGGCEVRIVAALGGPSRHLAACANPNHPRFSWSPDGHWLALSRGSGSHSGRLALLSLEDGTYRDLTPDSGGTDVDISPAFSPDGQSIAFLRNYSDSVGDLFVIDSAGGEPRRLTTDNADIMGLAWAEAGRSIVISSNRAGMYSLWRVPLRGGAPELLAGGGRKMKHPTASRGGERLAYEGWEYDMNLWRFRLGSADAANTGARVAAASDEWTFEPQFSPDARRIAFASTRSGSYEVWVCDSDGGNVERLTSFGGPYVGEPRWSPDSRQVVFVARPRGVAEVYIASLDGGRARRLVAEPTDAVAPSWSADGRWIYFGSRRASEWQIHKIAAEGGEVRQVTRTGGYAALESPDGAWVYHTRIDRPGLWRLPPGGGPVEQITNALQPEDWAAWGVTERGPYWVAHPEGDGPAVLMLALGSNEGTPLASLPQLAWPGLSLSPKGDEVVYSRLDHRESNLVLMTLLSSAAISQTPKR
jgi:Tol biopolymer transport system component/DNA-binding winged helix-turn-helix (wHTH) protein